MSIQGAAFEGNGKRDWKEEARKSGLPVFPILISPKEPDEIKPGGSKFNKRPLNVQHGHKDAVVGDGVDALNWTGANGYGIRMGGGLFTVDIDDYKDQAAALDWINAQAIPSDTLKHKTPSGGQHWVYTLPAGFEDLRGGSPSGYPIDTKGEGGWIAFGDGYERLNVTAPAELPVGVCEGLRAKTTGNAAVVASVGLSYPDMNELAEARAKKVIRASSEIQRALMDNSDGSAALFNVAAACHRQDMTIVDYSEVVMVSDRSPAYAHVIKEDREGRGERALERAWVKTASVPARDEFEIIIGFEGPIKAEPVDVSGFPVPKPFSTVVFPPAKTPIFGTWMAQEQLNVVYSRAGVGKTGFMMELLKATRDGTSLLGQSGHAPYTKDILWVNGDLPPALAELQLKDLGPIGADYMDMTDAATKRPYDLNKPEVWDLMMKTAKDYGIVVFDTRSSLFKGDHMDAMVADDLFTRLQSLARFGVCVWLCMHAGKPVANAPQSAFGSSASEWYVDNIVGLSRPNKTEWACKGNTSPDVKAALSELKAAGIARGAALYVDHEKTKSGQAFPTKAAGWASTPTGGRKLVHALTDV